MVFWASFSKLSRTTTSMAETKMTSMIDFSTRCSTREKWNQSLILQSLSTSFNTTRDGHIRDLWLPILTRRVFFGTWSSKSSPLDSRRSTSSSNIERLKSRKSLLHSLMRQLDLRTREWEHTSQATSSLSATITEMHISVLHTAIELCRTNATDKFIISGQARRARRLPKAGGSAPRQLNQGRKLGGRADE